MKILTKEELEGLQKQAFSVRETCLSLATEGGCFLGASLSAVDLLVYLYNKFLIIPNFSDPDRDYLFLSKGHDVPALYGVFVEKGWLARERLSHHLSVKDHIYWHPNRNIPGVEFYSGSLGHLLSIAAGVALDCKRFSSRRKRENKIVVILGDGELNEGSIWEALLVASSCQLDNLIIVVDRNEFQANERTEDLIPLEPLQEKFQAFGADVTRFNGHDFTTIHEAFSCTKENGKIKVYIADTVRGKGLPSIEKRADRWFCNFSHSELDALSEELKGKRQANITSEVLVVR